MSPQFWERLMQGIRLGDPEPLVGELGEAIQRSILSETYPESGGYRIFANIEVVRLLEGFSKIAEWQAADRAAGGKGNPGGVYEADGKVWKSITEVDALVVAKNIGGRWKIVELEQVKTGNSDKPAGAAAQNTKAMSGLKEIAGGSLKVRVYDRVSKNVLGENMTDWLDLTNLAEVKTTTRGLPGKGFGGDVLFPREVLVEVAKGLVEMQGLPSAHKSQPIPLTSGTQRRDEQP